MYQYGESFYGEGIPRDYTKAIKWYLMAAKQGNARAQLALGFLNLFGEGLPQNEKEAIRWIRLAAIQGDPSAQDGLGILYSSKDTTLAHMWYNIATANGNESSAKWRDDLAANMTPEEISKAQAMASECMSSGYKNCGW